MSRYVDGGADISFDSAEKRAQLERINLPQLTQEAAWLRNRLETEDHGQTRAKEVGYMTRRVNMAWQWLYAICRWVGVGVNVGASVCVCVCAGGEGGGLQPPGPAVRQHPLCRRLGPRTVHRLRVRGVSSTTLK